MKTMKTNSPLNAFFPLKSINKCKEIFVNSSFCVKKMLSCIYIMTTRPICNVLCESRSPRSYELRIQYL